MTNTNRIKLVAVNLEESADRRAKLLEHFGGVADVLPVEAFAAVDGYKLEAYATGMPNVSLLRDPVRNIVWLSDLNRPFCKPMSPGVLGASMSHLLVLEQLLNDPAHDAYIIAEDDVRLAEGVTADTLREFLGALPAPPTGLDVVHMNDRSLWWPLQLTEPVGDTGQAEKSHYSHIARQFFNCAASYLVTKQGAAKLMRYCRYSVSRPPDDLLSNAFIEGHIDVLAPTRPLFTVDYGFPSDVYREDREGRGSTLETAEQVQVQ